jgi:hypothetical protein
MGKYTVGIFHIDIHTVNFIIKMMVLAATETCRNIEWFCNNV